MQRGFAPIIILVGILVLALVGGGYYFLKNKIAFDQGGDAILIPISPSTQPSFPTISQNEEMKFTVKVIPTGNTNTVELGALDNGKTITVAVGMYIYLKFDTGNYDFSAEPAGILEIPQGRYNLPMNVIGQFKAVNQGTATITAKQKVVNDTTNKNYVCPQGWVNCMPGTAPRPLVCNDSEFLKWAKANCPDFKGVAD